MRLERCGRDQRTAGQNRGGQRAEPGGARSKTGYLKKQNWECQKAEPGVAKHRTAKDQTGSRTAVRHLLARFHNISVGATLIITVETDPFEFEFEQSFRRSETFIADRESKREHKKAHHRRKTQNISCSWKNEEDIKYIKYTHRQWQ